MNRDKQNYKWHIKIHREGEEIPSFFASHGIPRELSRILLPGALTVKRSCPISFMIIWRICRILS